MVICAVVQCGNRSGRDKGKRFFRLPSIISHQGDQALDLSRRRQREWLARINRKDIRPDQYDNVRVCGDHFISGSPSKLFEDNSLDWAPSLNLGYHTHTSCVSAGSGRHERALKRQQSRKRTIDELQSEPEAPSDDSTEQSEQGNNVPAVSTQTDLTMEGLAELEERAKTLNTPYVNNLEAELKDQREENSKLYATVNTLKRDVEYYSLSETFFKDNDEKVLFYTGLSTWELLDTLFVYVKPYLKQHSVLTPFQQLLATLMRLRLNLSGQDLAYRFKVHPSTISRIFELFVGLLYTKLKPLIIWPDRDALMKNNANGFSQTLSTLCSHY